MTTISKDPQVGSRLLNEIANKKSESISNNKKVDKNSSSKSSSVSSSNYDVSVSNEAKMLADSHKLAFETAKNTSPIREEKVESLKQKILSGKYSPSASDIADGMIKEAWYDKLALDLNDYEKSR